MSLKLELPDTQGRIGAYALRGTPIAEPRERRPFSRIALAAAHVVVDPLADVDPSSGGAIDWAATLAFRRRLLDLGLGVAEAMDTAQRGMGLDWPGARALIEHSLRAADPRERERIFSGVGTDHLASEAARSVDDVIRAYLEQLEAVQSLGGRVIVMASRALARVASGPDDYARVYSTVLAHTERPAILHWLGEMFDPALAGYWGSREVGPAMDTALGIIEADAARIDGIKISLLDATHEIAMRRRLPAGVRMYTGDDFNYPALIRGDEHGYSHALLGIFDPIAPAAAAALAALADGDEAAYERLFAPTVPLSRLIFRAPTQYYKTGVVFLAWLNGFQDHFVMLGGAQSMRPAPYFADVFRLADAAGLLRDPELAVARMRRLLALYGIGD